MNKIHIYIYLNLNSFKKGVFFFKPRSDIHLMYQKFVFSQLE